MSDRGPSTSLPSAKPALNVRGESPAIIPARARERHTQLGWSSTLPARRPLAISPELIALLLVLGLYLLPTRVAILRRRRNMAAIAAANRPLGWTVVGWIGSFVWVGFGRASASRGVRQPAAPSAGHGDS